MSRIVESLHYEGHGGGMSFIMDQDEEVEDGVGREIGKIFWDKNEPATFRSTGRDLTCDEMIAIALILYSKNKA